MNDTTYKALKIITDNVYKTLRNTGIIIEFGSNVIDLLKINGIKLRQKDGKLSQVNISIPKTKEGIAVGLRYIKKDGTKTEDLFLFQEGKPIVKGYKGDLEKTLPEYKGSHKLNR